MGEAVPQVHMAPPEQARLVTDPLERTIPSVLTLQTCPIKPILASTAIWVRY